MTDPDPSSQSPVVENAAAVARETAMAHPLDDFRAVYEAELDYVWRTLRRLGVPERDLEDLSHDVFVAFYRGRSSYDPTRPLKPWLFGIAFRVSSDFRRRAQHRYEIPSEHEAPDLAPGADEQYSAKQRRELVMRGLEALEPERRAVFVMHDLDGHSMPEIAQVLSVPLNTLYSRLRLAREQFAAAVKRADRRKR
jgi:RNA polymerase sigma-70 factor (ECF subfamily)